MTPFLIIVTIIAFVFGIYQHDRANYWRKVCANLLDVDENEIGKLKDVEIHGRVIIRHRPNDGNIDDNSNNTDTAVLYQHK